MLIVCPACASAYEIETDRVGPEGRAVRCAACRETWFVTPAATASDSEASADGEPASLATSAPPPDGTATSGEIGTAAAIIDQPSPPRRAKPRTTARAGDRFRSANAAGSAWRGLTKPTPAHAIGLVIFVALPLALLGRANVVRAMPRSAGLFAAVGLPVNLRGVEIRDVVAFRNPAEAGRPAQLVVEGDLVGVARDRVATSPLEIEIRDAAERPLFRWTAPAPRAGLEPAETARFRASLPSPPLQGSRIEVRFAAATASTAKPAEPAVAATPHADDAHPSARHAGH